MPEITKQNMRWRRYLWVVITSTVFGIGLGTGAIFANDGEFFLMGALQGASTGFILGATAIYLYVVLPRTRLGEIINAQPLWVSISIETIALTAVIILAIRVTIGIFYPIDISGTPLDSGFFMFATGLSLLFSFLLGLAIEVSRLIGPRVFRLVLTGAYRKPKEEDRFFLMVDIKGSTAMAEKLGGLKFHQFLHRFVRDITVPILANHGDIYKYVGDEVIVSWPAADGLKSAQALRCFFDIQEVLRKREAYYREHYLISPEVRGALHFGTIVAGEMGDIRTEIAFIGDPLNVASRIAQVGSELDKDFVISAETLALFEDDGLYQTERLQVDQLRGRTQKIDLLSLQ